MLKVKHRTDNFGLNDLLGNLALFFPQMFDTTYFLKLFEPYIYHLKMKWIISVQRRHAYTENCGNVLRLQSIIPRRLEWSGSEPLQSWVLLFQYIKDDVLTRKLRQSFDAGQ